MTPAAEVVNRYLARMPGAGAAYHNDPTYYAHVNFMRSVLMAADMAMEDEGIAAETRLRVLRAVIYGAPDVESAEARMRERELAVERLSGGRWQWP